MVVDLTWHRGAPHHNAPVVTWRNPTAHYHSHESDPRILIILFQPCLNLWVCTHMCVCLCVCMCVLLCWGHVCDHAHLSVCLYVCVLTCVYVWTSTLVLYLCMFVCCEHANLWVCLYMCTCVCFCVSEHAHLCVCLYVCAYVCMCVFLYVPLWGMNICMYCVCAHEHMCVPVQVHVYPYVGSVQFYPDCRFRCASQQASDRSTCLRPWSSHRRAISSLWPLSVPNL